MMFYILSFILMLTNQHGMVVADERNCPSLQCDPRTTACPYQSFYADISSRTICRACNVCIKPGSPVDSKGCPQLPCPKTVPSGACMHPWFHNSWVMYNGIQCQTCESLLCNV
ncbi:uncharacterized protein LOC132743968 [Ruditapes philippinarum]|uniref:uncharacterized protein LOC132743968 n=1 Tax=Ruditapes philippinarum TaxID=129788 RepID=UPI00295C3A8F|nr:uncharacterized protein LOC132743968 [Ruditapes philippinarum]